MIQELLAHWPLVIIAQVLGVGIARGADALGVAWRRDGDIVFSCNMLGLLVVTPIVVLSALFSTYSQQDVLNLAAMLLAWLVWLFGVAWVQKRQLQISLRAAFFGAMMQSGIFVLAFGLAGAVSFGVADLRVDWFTFTLLLSMLGTYFLLTLFRPQLGLLWNSIGQNFRKNQPLR